MDYTRGCGSVTGHGWETRVGEAENQIWKTGENEVQVRIKISGSAVFGSREWIGGKGEAIAHLLG